MTKRATKATTTKATKATAKKPAQKKATAKAADETVKTVDDGDELCTFALRLPRSERTRIHEAAGPAKASSFVRRVAVAAASLDTKALEAIVKETRERLEA